jgi:Arm DNA-binding domain/Phage integrase central domain
MKKVLTDKTVKSLKPAHPGSRYIVADAVVPGLGVRVTDRGHRTFVLGARYPGSPHFKRRELGEVGAVTLAGARDKARAWLAQIKAGVDPRETEARQRAAISEAASNTFAALAETFISRHLKGQRKGKRVAREINNELVTHWGARPVTAITRRDVVELIEAIVDRPSLAYAHNIFGHVRMIFNWAIALRPAPAGTTDRGEADA